MSIHAHAEQRRDLDVKDQGKAIAIYLRVTIFRFQWDFLPTTSAVDYTKYGHFLYTRLIPFDYRTPLRLTFSRLFKHREILELNQSISTRKNDESCAHTTAVPS